MAADEGGGNAVNGAAPAPAAAAADDGAGASAGRAKRRCVLRRTAVPSAAHYVGYVEDGETPAMIARKFEAMERILAARRVEAAAATAASPQDDTGAAAGTSQPLADDPSQAADANDGGGGGGGGGAPADLDDADLARIFAATSVFSVRSVLRGNEAVLARAPFSGGGGGGGARRGGGRVGAHAADADGGFEEDRDGWSDGELCSDEEDEERLLEELRGFWSDDGGGYEAARRRAQRRQKAGSGGRRGSMRPTARPASAPRERRKPRVAAAEEGAQPAAAGNGAAKAAAAGAAAAESAAAVGAVGAAEQPALRQGRAAGPRRPRVLAPDAVLHLRVPPPPLPTSWGRAVRPWGAPLHWRPDAARGGDGDGEAPAPLLPPGQLHCCADVCAFDFATLAEQRRGGFLAVVVNSGWERVDGSTAAEAAADAGEGEGGGGGGAVAAAAAVGTATAAAGSGSDGSAAAAAAAAAPTTAPDGWADALAAARRAATRRLARLPLRALCPRGFVFVWAAKRQLAAVVACMRARGFAYVESLAWVFKGANNAVRALPADEEGGAPAPALLPRAHATLLVFRRSGPEARGVELRHQRNPDVVFGCLRPAPGGGGNRAWRTPQEVYATLETLLPGAFATNDGGDGGGGFLELWAPADAAHARPGWVHVAEGGGGGGEAAG